MAVDFLRDCYSSQWRLYDGRPDILVDGYYYKSPPGTRVFPSWHFVGSRNWQRGQWDKEVELGEVRSTPHAHEQGQVPIPTPADQFIGSLSCLAEGERTLPPPRWRLIGITDDVIPIFVSVQIPFPSVIFSWNPNEACLPLLATDDSVILADTDTPILAACPDCFSILAAVGVPLLADDDHVLLAECPAECQAIKATDDDYLLATDDDVLEASCGPS